ncbi:MAG: hypothetical protein ACK6AD_04460 [Cyanobacteriota bacterium]
MGLLGHLHQPGGLLLGAAEEAGELMTGRQQLWRLGCGSCLGLIRRWGAKGEGRSSSRPERSHAHLAMRLRPLADQGTSAAEMAWREQTWGLGLS